MPDKIVSIGRGLVGRAWTIAFARAGYDVALVGREGVAADEAWTAIETNLKDLEAVGAIESATEVRSRITGTNDLAEALDGAKLAMENYPENRDIKHDLFAEMDRHAGPDCILCSSASGISTSEFTEDLEGRHRCLVTHPCNPPSFLRVVEISPAPGDRARSRRSMPRNHGGHRQVHRDREEGDHGLHPQPPAYCIGY